MMRFIFIIFFFSIFLCGCSTPPPKHQNNICAIFKEYPHWYWATLNTQHRWHVPIGVQMAIIGEESHFQSSIRPPRGKLLHWIPWFRETSAEGYAQALNNTWRLYLQETHQRSASRSNFAKSVDFIGWYAHRVHRAIGIPINNAYAIYLAYHEGIQGYLQKDYMHEPWLMAVARKVQRRANLYHRQLIHCENKLSRKPWWWL